LRRVLEAEGITDLLWREVSKSSKAPAQIERLLKEVPSSSAWGGDGMVQRCVEDRRA
jgi:hypothetical protein